MSEDSTYCYSGAEDFVIENGVMKGLESPYLGEYTSYGELILDRLRASAKSVGQINGLTGEEETFGEMMERSVRCAIWLKKQNIQVGDVVALSSDIRMEVYVPALASLYVGAVFNAWWDVGVTKDVTRHFLNLTKPKVLFTNEASAIMAVEVAQELGIELKVVVLGKLPDIPSLEDILKAQDSKLVSDFRCTQLKSVDAPAFLGYTSGTTGLPKAAVHSHRSLFGNLDLASKLGDVSDSNVVAVLLFSPLSWITGLLLLLRSVISRQTKIIYPEFKEETTLQLIEKFKVKWMFLGVSGAVRILKCAAFGKYDLSSLEFMFLGGAVLKEETQRALVKSFPHATILQAYGATELGGLGVQQSANYKPGSCGRVVKNISMKVVDPETGRILGPNTTGEACFKSPFMMTGYYKNPEATNNAVDSEGWYHTGDLVHYDEEGHIFITDRIKEMIKYRGYHVSPAMVEQLIQAHPGVCEVAVIGVPHEEDDERAVAFVVKTQSSNVTKEELLKLVSDTLPDYMRLRGGVMFLDELPHTASGKVARTNLRQLAKSHY